jgi:hypothetical protein
LTLYFARKRVHRFRSTIDALQEKFTTRTRQRARAGLPAAHIRLRKQHLGKNCGLDTYGVITIEGRTNTAARRQKQRAGTERREHRCEADSRRMEVTHFDCFCLFDSVNLDAPVPLQPQAMDGVAPPPPFQPRPIGEPYDPPWMTQTRAAAAAAAQTAAAASAQAPPPAYAAIDPASSVEVWSAQRPHAAAVAQPDAWNGVGAAVRVSVAPSVDLNSGPPTRVLAFQAKCNQVVPQKAHTTTSGEAHAYTHAATHAGCCSPDASITVPSSSPYEHVAASAAAARRCAACSASLPSGEFQMRFCPACGVKLT